MCVVRLGFRELVEGATKPGPHCGQASGSVANAFPAPSPAPAAARARAPSRHRCPLHPVRPHASPPWPRPQLPSAVRPASSPNLGSGRASLGARKV